MVRVQIGSEFPVIDDSTRNVDMVSTKKKKMETGLGSAGGTVEICRVYVDCDLREAEPRNGTHVPYGEGRGDSVRIRN